MAGRYYLTPHFKWYLSVYFYMSVMFFGILVFTPKTPTATIPVDSVINALS